MRWYARHAHPDDRWWCSEHLKGAIMMWRVSAAVLVALIAVAAGASSAASAQTGCASGFVLMQVREILSTLATPGSEATIKAADVNGDGYLCVQLAPGGGLAQFTDD